MMVIASRRRHAPGALETAALMGACSLWSVLYAVQSILTELYWKELVHHLTYIGILAVPAAWLAFALRYTGRGQRLYRSGIWLLAIEPVLALTAILTNSLHHLFWTSSEIVQIGSFLYLRLDHGPLFWIHSIYSYALLLIATFHLVRTIGKSAIIYRRQIIILMIGFVIPWVLNALYLLGGAPIPGLDPTPLGFTLTGVALILGVYRFGLLDLSPLARSTMIEVMSDGMLVLNNDSRIVDINPAACRIFNCSNEDAIGHRAVDFFGRWPELVNRYHGVANVHEPVSREVNGQLRTFDLQISPLNDRGNLVGRLILIRDISEERRTQVALQESEERYRLLVETSPDAIFMTDMKGVLVFWNKAASRMHDLVDDAPLAGMSVYDFVVPDDQERLREFSRHVRASGTLQSYEYRGVTNTGREFPGEVSLSIYSDAEGNPKGFIAVLRDVTNRKMAEEEIRRAAQSERLQRELADALRDIGSCLSETLDFEAIMDQLLTQVERVVPYDSANVTMLHGNQAQIARSRGYQKFGEHIPEALHHHVFEVDKTEAFRWMIENKQPMVIPDIYQYPDWVLLEETKYIRSWIGAPIIARGEVIAFFSLDKCEPDFYRLEHLETLAAFAAQAGLALQNARLYEETASLLEREQHLNEILYKIGSSLDLSIVLDDILRLGCELIRAEGSLLGLINKECTQVTVSHAYNFPKGSFEDVLEKGEGLTWEIIENGAPVLLEKYETHPKARKKLMDYGVRSMLMVPVRVGDDILGVLGFYLIQPGTETFSNRDIPLAEAIGREAGVAIENARLFESAKKRAEEADTLREASNAITSALEVESVLDQIMTNLDRVVPYDSCAIFLQDGDALRIVAARGFPDVQKVLGHTFPTESPLTAEGIQTGKVIIIPDAQQDERFQGWGDSAHVRGWMGVPLFAHGAVTGFLTIDSRSQGAYGETDAELAQAFANQAAIAIENARLFEKVQHLAVTDPLTELFNRRQFFELTRREFYRSRRYGDVMALIMLDVDDLKLVNDTYGHQVGDQLIQFIGEQCSSQLRQADIAARYAGDEFIIALPGTDLEGGLQVARRIKERTAAGFAVDDSTLLHVAVTIGVSELDETSFSLEMLITRADKSLYAAKAAGKNCIGAWSGGEFKVYE